MISLKLFWSNNPGSDSNGGVGRAEDVSDYALALGMRLIPAENRCHLSEKLMKVIINKVLISAAGENIDGQTRPAIYSAQRFKMHQLYESS
ncbi:hypothetical protein O3W44_01665 [Pantoea sp. LMR881]|uniref:hypothetical protein n=1 Tax=Pantoea sp. LMR881 TaxID=3014336 RepID=UPI0022AECA31|nr:hypothetical protein [Pantoea sp. LMR881]MCZ4058074.1 hypothetical protein [Pantoea sp. LMR881]